MGNRGPARGRRHPGRRAGRGMLPPRPASGQPAAPAAPALGALPAAGIPLEPARPFPAPACGRLRPGRGLQGGVLLPLVPPRQAGRGGAAWVGRHRAFDRGFRGGAPVRGRAGPAHHRRNRPDPCLRLLAPAEPSRGRPCPRPVQHPQSRGGAAGAELGRPGRRLDRHLPAGPPRRTLQKRREDHIYEKADSRRRVPRPRPRHWRWPPAAPRRRPRRPPRPRLPFPRSFPRKPPPFSRPWACRSRRAKWPPRTSRWTCWTARP